MLACEGLTLLVKPLLSDGAGPPLESDGAGPPLESDGAGPPLLSDVAGRAGPFPCTWMLHVSIH